jgi:23S rRNA pseudouridine1911/1915/1917 synthase
MRVSVLYEDNHLLVVNKPAGTLSQGDITGDISIVDWTKSYIRDKYSKSGNVFVGLPHRLDRPVSGALILTKTSKALARLNRAFKHQEVTKYYLAITENMPPDLSGKLVHMLRKDDKVNKTLVDNTKGKKSVCHYKVIAEASQRFLIQVQPLTGRPHQIRVQLAAIGCPIWGDRKYGWDGSSNEGWIALHCRKIQWIHPVKKENMTVLAPIPQQGEWLRFRESIP